MKVGLRYTDDLDPCSVRVTNTSRKGIPLRPIVSNRGSGILNTCNTGILSASHLWFK